MDNIAVNNNQFTHYPKRIPKGTVNAEKVQFQLDKEWDGLTVILHWLNVASGVEIAPMLERDKPNTIPWEVLEDLGELRMGLVGMDGDTTVKPTIWLAYGYVVDGVDPDRGDDPQAPTQNYLAQMVEQATHANQAAQEAKDYAQQVAESIENAGPYAEEAKKAAEAAKTSEGAAQTAAQEAQRSQQAAQEAVASIGTSVEQAQQAATDAGAAKGAAETAQAGAAQSAGTAQSAAVTASQAAQTAQSSATQAGQYLATVEADAQSAASAATAAGESQEAAQNAAQEAGNARDQANTAATTAQGHADAAGTAKEAAEQAAGNAATAKTGAEQAAQSAAWSATASQQAKENAEAAAAVLPKPTQKDAGKVPMVNPEGTGYIFGAAGESATERILLSETTDREVASFSVTGLNGIKSIRAVLNTPAADANTTYLVIKFYVSGKYKQVYTFASAPRNVQSKISIKLQVSDAGLGEMSINGATSSLVNIEDVCTANFIGNAAQIFNVFRTEKNGEITSFSINAYGAVFPSGSICIIEGAGK